MADSLGHKATTGAIWASIDKFGSMGLQFVVNLILARLLMPSDFGAIGMLAIFISVSQVLIDGGFGAAILQKKETTQTDFSTIFWWNLLFSLFLYGILFLIAPFVGAYYKMPILTNILRVIGINVILSSILAIQTNRLKKFLAFKTIAITSIISHLIASGIAITMAYFDFGVWSLVGMQLTYASLMIIGYGAMTRWIPTLVFSYQSWKSLFGFGVYMLASNVLQSICQNIQGLIIGKKFSAQQMGYYSQAYKLDQVTSYSIPQVIVQVMYPVYASIQDDKDRLGKMILMNIRVITLLIFPILGLLILIGEPLISFLYGEKWLPSVPYFKIFCVGGLFVCLQNITYYGIAAVGKSKPLFQWSFYKWGFLLIALLIGMNFGMYGILWGMVCSNINIFLINAILVDKYVGLKIWTQIKAISSVFIGIAGSYLISALCHLVVDNLLVEMVTYFLCLAIYCFTLRPQAVNDTLYVIP